jgi:hypothetical protein
LQAVCSSQALPVIQTISTLFDMLAQRQILFLRTNSKKKKNVDEK